MDWSRGVKHNDVIVSHPFFADQQVVEIESMLPREHGNKLYRVETNSRLYVVRFLTRNETDPDAEYRTTQLAQAAKIGPEIFWYDPIESMMILDYIPGGHRSDVTTKEIEVLTRTLRRLHTIETLDLDLPKIDLVRIVSADRPEITEAFHVIERHPKHPALCHNDLTPHNMIWQKDHVVLIDFEFAAIGDVCFDLAAVCVEFSLDTKREKQLIKSYFGTAACPAALLAAFKTIYRALRRQWFARQGIDQIP